MVSLQTIAAEANLSVGTVSQVLGHDDTRYSRHTRERVHGIARRHGYRPNRLAHAMIRGKTESLGIVVHSFTSPVVMSLVEALAGLTRDCGYQIFLVESADPTMHKEREAIENLLGRRVDGLIVLAEAECDTSYYQALYAQKIPLVLIGVQSQPGKLPWVYVDPQLGTYLATQHLLELGHRRIAFAPCRYLASISWGRVAGYRQALQESGIAYDGELVLADRPTSVSAVHEFTRARLTGAAPPTAFLYNDDEMALVGIQALHGLGLAVPDDVSVVGYNDTSFAAYTSPALTTIRQPLAECARAAVELLLRCIGQGLPEGKSVVCLKPTLVVRQSSTSVRAQETPQTPGDKQ